MSDAEGLFHFLVQLCDTNTMKNVTAESLIMKIVEVEGLFIKDSAVTFFIVYIVHEHHTTTQSGL